MLRHFVERFQGSRAEHRTILKSKGWPARGDSWPEMGPNELGVCLGQRYFNARNRLRKGPGPEHRIDCASRRPMELRHLQDRLLPELAAENRGGLWSSVILSLRIPAWVRKRGAAGAIPERRAAPAASAPASRDVRNSAGRSVRRWASGSGHARSEGVGSARLNQDRKLTPLPAGGSFIPARAESPRPLRRSSLINLG